MNTRRVTAPSPERLDMNAELYRKWTEALKTYHAKESALADLIKRSNCRRDGLLGEEPIGISNETARQIATSAIEAHEAGLNFTHLEQLRLVEQQVKAKSN